MAQFIINMDNSLPASQKFIIHVLDNTHLFVQPHVTEMIRSAIAEFREQISYEKPTWIRFSKYTDKCIGLPFSFVLYLLHFVQVAGSKNFHMNKWCYLLEMVMDP